MEDGLLCAFKRFHSPFNELRTARGEGLEPNIVRHHARGSNEVSSEVELSIRGGGVRDFNFFVAKANEHLEKSPFLISVLYDDERPLYFEEVVKVSPDTVPLDQRVPGSHLLGPWKAIVGAYLTFSRAIGDRVGVEAGTFYIFGTDLSA